MTGAAPITPAEQAGTAQVNGITIAYESYGSPEGETILLIGATGQKLVGWPIELVTELVERGYRVVLFDNRDVGLSTKLTEASLPDPAVVSQAHQEAKPAPIPYTLRDMAQDAVGLLDALGIGQAHLVGVSIGGAIAQWAAIDHPERVLSLPSIAADSGNPELPVISNPEAFAGVPPQPTTADREAFINWQVKTAQVRAGSTYPTDEATLRTWAERDFDRGFDPAGLVRQQTASLVDHFAPAAERLNNLKEIKVPTIIVQGTEDPLVPMASAEDLAAHIPNAELRGIPGLGHFISAALIVDIVDAILAAAERTTQPLTPGIGLLNISWQLDSFGSVGATTSVIAGSTITLTFNADGQVSGVSGCNSYGGAYTAQNGSLEFEEIVSTLVACADPALNDQEGRYLQALRSADRYALASKILTIWYGEDSGVLNFVRSPVPAAPPMMPTVTEPPERVELDVDGGPAQRSNLLPSSFSVKQYVLAAAAGQELSVDITSDMPLSLNITTPSSVARIPETSPVEGGGYRTNHTFTLDKTSDYLVTLTKADHTPSSEYTVTFALK